MDDSTTHERISITKGKPNASEIAALTAVLLACEATVENIAEDSTRHRSADWMEPAPQGGRSWRQRNR
ncbi:acyl-CoA carboxylase subunit epsilon [Actinopolyspora sp. H202]|uniref:acyl-CoA carboxylase subunit epsilon n=1 Tax=Actinopolyspora sp. H202 TaxID=1500456 RepID=UPI003EE4DFD2